MTANFVLNTSLRGQGSAFYAMFGIMSGGILNIVLDPIFIFGLGMGIRGRGDCDGAQPAGQLWNPALF